MHDLGEAKQLLGIEINHDRVKGIVTMSQRKYIETILKRFNMEDANPSNTPLPPGTKLQKADSKPLEENVPYREAIGALMHLMVL